MIAIVVIVVAVVVAVALGLVLSYNRFVTQRTLIKTSWANIDTELKRRYDLIPNLVETVKGYAAHERQTLEALTAARAAATSATGSPASQAAAEGPLVGALRQVFAVAEAYPDLKANANFLELQHELETTEDRLQAARRFYNANVQAYNRRIGTFPSSVIAARFGFKEEQLFEIEPAMRAQMEQPPKVDFSAPPAVAAPDPPPAVPPTTS